MLKMASSRAPNFNHDAGDGKLESHAARGEIRKTPD